MGGNDLNLIEQQTGLRTGDIRKIRKKKETACTCFHEYASHTSIHGVQYLSEDHRPLWERFFWIFVFIISIYTCSKMIFALWTKWNDTPVIVTFDERETEIWKIPFPAITICPQTKASKKLFSFEEIQKTNGENITDDQALLKIVIYLMDVLMKDGAFACDCSYKLKFYCILRKRYLRVLHHVCELRDTVNLTVGVHETDEINIISILNDVFNMEEPDVTLKTKDLSDDVRKIVTDEGICYVINGLNMKDIYSDDSVIPDIDDSKPFPLNWNRETGYQGNFGLKAYPRRILGSGVKLGMRIVLINDVNDVDNLCSQPPDGFKVLIHSPDNFPMISSKYFHLPPRQHIITAIKPSILWTSNQLRNYSPEKRNCFFNGERTLKFFKVYTEINCNFECLTRYTLSNCDCVKFSMPRFNGTRICQSFDEVECYKNAEEEFLSLEIEAEFAPNIKNLKADCNCLPPCSTIVYNIESSQSELDLTKVLQVIEEPNVNKIPFGDLVSSSQLTFFFKENSFLTSKRSELYGMSEFVANCGGLLGLFMGFSMLSFVEIFYFSTIRLISNYFRNKNKTETQ